MLGIRQEWEASVLFACKPTDMARRHAQAVRAHAVAVNVSGNMDSVAASCGATLDFLAKIVEVVTSLWNRNLTAAYWERIEGCLPIGDVRRREIVVYFEVSDHSRGVRSHTPHIRPTIMCLSGWENILRWFVTWSRSK